MSACEPSSNGVLIGVKAHGSIDGTCCGFCKPGATLLLSHSGFSDSAMCNLCKQES